MQGGQPVAFYTGIAGFFMWLGIFFDEVLPIQQKLLCNSIIFWINPFYIFDYFKGSINYFNEQIQLRKLTNELKSESRYLSNNTVDSWYESYWVWTNANKPQYVDYASKVWLEIQSYEKMVMSEFHEENYEDYQA